MDTILLTLKDLAALAETTARNGTSHNFPAVALQWAAGAQAEIDRLRAEVAKLDELTDRQSEHISDLAGEVAALREDAERYRWLVNSGKYTPCMMGDGWAMICGYREIKPTKAELDAAIDNARKA